MVECHYSGNLYNLQFEHVGFKSENTKGGGSNINLIGDRVMNKWFFVPYY
jgi:hypothetical protein